MQAKNLQASEVIQCKLVVPTPIPQFFDWDTLGFNRAVWSGIRHSSRVWLHL